MPQSTPAQWDAARLEWECDPTMTLTDVAAKLGVALPTVSVRAARDGWMKLSQRATERDMQHQVADVLGQISRRDELLDQVGAALDLSVNTRVLVINKHRSELTRWRQLFPLESMASDPVCARRGKLAAEALSIVQRSECIAFGLITYTGQATDAPLVDEVTEEDKPLSPWQKLMESYRLTGRAPEEFHAPQLSHTPEIDPDRENDQ
jgi:hypothetical protein